MGACLCVLCGAAASKQHPPRRPTQCVVRLGGVNNTHKPQSESEIPYLRDSVTMADDDLIDYNEEEEETPVVHVAGSKK